jgi:GT2 family glycosyltransferase
VTPFPPRTLSSPSIETLPLSVTVVVCNYNGEQHLPACLGALAAMAGDVVETIVVDNASSDRSLELLERDFPHVRVVQVGYNAGPCVARNVGMREAKTRLVLALDNDAVVSAETLERLLSAHQETGAAIVQPRSVFDSEPDRVHYDGGHFHYVGLIRLRNFYRPLAEAEGEGTLDVDCAISMCLLLDVHTILGMGGYDERYFILFEDYDLSYRLRSAGERIVSVEDTIVRHRAGTPGISFRDGPRYPSSRVFYHSRNRWVFLAKNHQLRTLLVTAPGCLLYECVGLLFALMNGHPFAWVRGKWAALRMIAGLGADRRSVQSARKLRDRELLVGGGLTVTPAAAAKPARAALLRLVNGALGICWSFARPFL